MLGPVWLVSLSGATIYLDVQDYTVSSCLHFSPKTGELNWAKNVGLIPYAPSVLDVLEFIEGLKRLLKGSNDASVFASDRPYLINALRALEESLI